MLEREAVLFNDSDLKHWGSTAVEGILVPHKWFLGSVLED